MRKDDDSKNAQLQLEIAVRKGDTRLITEALKMAWDESMTWQDELTSSDIARILDAMETFTDSAEVIRWGICALQAIVAEEVKDSTSRQYSVQSILRVGPFKIYDNELGERILHKKLVTEVEEFEKAAANMLAGSFPDFKITPDLVGFGRIRPDKLAKQNGVWLVPFEIQMGLSKELAYQLRDHVHSMLETEAELQKLAQHGDLNEALKPEDSELVRIKKELKKKQKKARGEPDEEAEEEFKVPVTAVKVKHAGKEMVDPRCTIVDDPCTYKVAKGVDVVLVAMTSHPKNVDVQHCAAYLLRWIMAWGDQDVAQVMTAAKAEDEIEAAMNNHPAHRSLQTHCRFALRRLRELNAGAS